MPKTRKQRNNKNNFRNKTYEKLLDRMVGGKKASIQSGRGPVSGGGKELCRRPDGREYVMVDPPGCARNHIYYPNGRRYMIKNEKMDST